MGFIVAKTILFLILPPSGILLLLFAGIVLVRRHRAAGMSLQVLGAALLWFLSMPTAADLLIRPLESYAPPFSGTAEKIDAVVVLGSGVRDLSWVPAPAAPAGTSLERLAAGIGIARHLRTRLVLSGGTGEIAGGDVREADAMAETAVLLGFPRASLLAENASRNTIENAAAVSRLISGRTIVLVTSAFHMRRAAALFRKQGFTVLPAPTAYLAQTRVPSWSNILPRADALFVSSAAISERLSLLWYGMQGRI